MTTGSHTRLPDADAINLALLEGFGRERNRDTTRRSHFFHGRYENLYIPRECLPEVEPILAFATAQARLLTGIEHLKSGFWFNAMGPGHRTTRHAHEELDELLSCVYYVRVPPHSGRLVLFDENGDRHTVDPEPGLIVFFPPWLEHEVEENCSDSERLSLAINFGPA